MSGRVARPQPDSSPQGLTMTKWLGAVALAAGLLGTALAVEAKSIDEIMKRVNSAKGIQRKLLPDAAKAGDWDNAQKLSKEYVELAEQLGKNKPPKGEQKSWEKLTGDYLVSVKKVDEACQKKDAAAVTAAQRKIGAMCKSCHDAHKGD